MTICEDATPIAADASHEARAGAGRQATALILHLTKTAQVELEANQELRRRLVEAEADSRAYRQIVERLQVARARAQDLAETRALMVRNSEDKLRRLGTALTSIQRTAASQDLLIADVLASPWWRATAPLRRLRGLWRRSVLYRPQRRKLAGHFHRAWFVREYPAAAILNEDPFTYFMAQGLARDLNPNPYFDMRWYLKRYTDVADLGLHPLSHFAAHGFAEGRDPHPDVSCAAYRARYRAGWGEESP